MIFIARRARVLLQHVFRERLGIYYLFYRTLSHVVGSAQHVIVSNSHGVRLLNRFLRPHHCLRLNSGLPLGRRDRVSDSGYIEIEHLKRFYRVIYYII